jgi:hypothetical protein
MPFGPGFEQVGIFNPDHGCARAAGENYGRIGFKDFDSSFGEVYGLGAKTAVKKWLAAACLLPGKGDFAACLSEQFYCGKPHLRHNLIYQTGNT